jgi:hypothetical protein
MGKPHKRFAVKKLKRSARGELECVPSEAARRDEDATICALRRDHSEQFSDWLDWDLPVQPVLALDNHPLVAADKLEVGATVGVGSAALPHEIALPAVGFTDKVQSPASSFAGGHEHRWPERGGSASIAA